MNERKTESVTTDIDPMLDTGRAAREAVRLLKEELKHIQRIDVNVEDLRKRAEAWDKAHGKMDGWKFLRNVANYITGEIDKRSK